MPIIPAPTIELTMLHTVWVSVDLGVGNVDFGVDDDDDDDDDDKSISIDEVEDVLGIVSMFGEDGEVDVLVYSQVCTDAIVTQIN